MTESLSRPACDACRDRVESVLDSLRDQVVVDYWVNELGTSSFCEENYGPLADLCKYYVPIFVPALIDINIGKDWVPAFCSDFGCTK